MRIAEQDSRTQTVTLRLTEEAYTGLLDAVDDARILAQHRHDDQDAATYMALLDALRTARESVRFP